MTDFTEEHISKLESAAQSAGLDADTWLKLLSHIRPAPRFRHGELYLYKSSIDSWDVHEHTAGDTVYPSARKLGLAQMPQAVANLRADMYRLQQDAISPIDRKTAGIYLAVFDSEIEP